MKSIIKLAIPSIITNITIPLLALVDLAIVGRLGSAEYIAAISLGGATISILYWNFGFLRMSTTGLTAQSYGAKDFANCGELLMRALSIALIGGLVLSLFRTPLINLILSYVDATNEVKEFVKLYFSICILGAPAALMIYVMKGWLVGMQNTRATMVIALGVNIANILLSCFLVFGLHMKVSGVALGTLISQYIGLAICAIILKQKYNNVLSLVIRENIFKDLGVFFKVNVLIMVRNLCMIAVTNGFTFLGSKYGETQLSVNTMLMQLFYFFSYFMDGFAYAGEALTGKFTGADDNNSLYSIIKKLFVIGAVMALIFTIVYIFFAYDILRLLTDDIGVLSQSQTSLHYASFIPYLSFAAFLWDGIMVGRTQTKAMVLTLVISSILFFVTYYYFEGEYGNHALWCAFLLYLASRSIIQTMLRNLK